MGSFGATEQGWFFVGGIAVFVLIQIAGLIKTAAGRPDGSKELIQAEKVLARHKMSAHSYIPTIGIDDIELRDALDRVAMSGKVIVHADGQVVGRLLPKSDTKGETRLRLIVDNTK